LNNEPNIERIHGFETKALTDRPAPRYFEDFQVGEVLISPTFLASEEDIVWFAERYDPQYYHLDTERARQSMFGGLVAGGFQTAAIAWGLALRTGYFEGTAVAGIEIESLRWLLPMRVGDVVHAEFKLVEGRPSRSNPGLATTKFEYTIVNQRGECILRTKLVQIMKCRPKDIP
jgi:acyl dehydratase